MHNKTRTTIVDRKAQIVGYDDLELPELIEYEDYPETDYIVTKDGPVLAMCDILREPTGGKWDGSLSMGYFGAYRIWLRDDETAMVAFTSF